MRYFEVTLALGMVLLLIASAAIAAEPKAIVSVTTTEAGLVIVDARKSVGALTWKIHGEHWLIADGRVAVLGDANTVVALAAVADGRVDLLLLPGRTPAPPPDPADDSLTDKVRKIAADLGLPADERAKVAKIHSDLALLAGTTIKQKFALFKERSRRIRGALAFPNNDWSDFFDAVNKLLDKIGAPPGVEGAASDFVISFKQIAAGLQ